MTDGPGRRGPGPGRIALSLEPLTEVLLPGGTPRRLEITLHNHGPEVEQIELRPVGPLAPWVTLEQPLVRIWPRQRSRLGLSIRIPAGPEVSAGPTVLALAARTGDGAHAEAHVPVEVAMHLEVDLPEPEPHAIKTPRLAEVRLRVDNRSNVPVQVAVSATDREGRLQQERPRSSFPLGPGGSASVVLGLSCRSLIWRGRSRPHEYTVSAEVLPPASAGPAEPVAPSVTGVLVQDPVLRVWWLLLWVALVLVTGVLMAGDGGVLVVLLLFSLTLGWSGFVVVRVLHGLLVIRRVRSTEAPARSFPQRAGS